MFVDAHTHLNSEELRPKAHELITSCKQSDIIGMTNIGCDIQSSYRAVEIAKIWSSDAMVSVYAAVGIHPAEVSYGKVTHSNALHEHIKQLHHLIEKERAHIRAIGECGIDAHYPGYDMSKDLQKTLFTEQCRLAETFDLPVIIHTRDAFEATWEVVENFPEVRFYFHCRGYDPSAIDIIAQRQAPTRVGFCGNITYRNAEHIRQSFLSAYRSKNLHIVLETDAPYLAPQSKRGTENTPLNIIDIYEYTALLLDIPQKDRQEHVYQNWKMLYEPDHLGAAPTEG